MDMAWMEPSNFVEPRREEIWAVKRFVAREME